MCYTARRSGPEDVTDAEGHSGGLITVQLASGQDRSTQADRMNRLRLLWQHRMILTLFGQSIFSVKLLMMRLSLWDRNHVYRFCWTLFWFLDCSNMHCSLGKNVVEVSRLLSCLLSLHTAGFSPYYTCPEPRALSQCLHVTRSSPHSGATYFTPP